MQNRAAYSASDFAGSMFYAVLRHSITFVILA